MQKIILLSGILLLLGCNTNNEQNQDPEDWETIFEKSNGTETPEYAQVIDFYTELAKSFSQIKLETIGETDSGFPLHLVIFNPDQQFDFKAIRKDKQVLLINNGIHPGESDGIDATMLLFKDLALGNIDSPKNTVITAIPLYNIGGALQRNSSTRTNQNGPKEYGFRGNAKNYDLNRDFIKSDTKNALAFSKIFHLVQPDIFIDNHVSNGADYQYTLTHLFTQHNKLGSELGTYLHKVLQPTLETSLAKKQWDITPYVNVWGTTPDKGWSQFFDSPRYSTGYTALWNCLGTMVETHMLKPYNKRVEGTYELMVSMLEILEKDGKKIRSLRENAMEHFKNSKLYTIQWQIDTTQHTTFQFKGYEASYPISEVTGLKRLQYDSSKPYQKEVAYNDFFTPTKEIQVPEAYIIPKGWWNISQLLDQNVIEYQKLNKDTTFLVEVYHIKEYKTRKTPYEGHYLHYNTQVTTTLEKMTFVAGDILIPTQQNGIRYLLETLEPEAVDSFFNWNFFDTILQQKEGFSSYVWEDKAATLLKNNKRLNAQFLEKKKDSQFASNAYLQLDWIHKQSQNYEKAHLRYPVYRKLR